MEFFKRTLRSRAAHLTIAAVLFTSGVALSQVYDFELRIQNVNAAQDTSVYAPEYARRSGLQLVMVYFGSASCAWSNRPSLRDAVETIKQQLARQAEDQGMTFKAVGVALDWSPERGIEHLETMGRFDEISAGYNWGNTLALQHIWSDGSALPRTPQILVYKRILVAPQRDRALHYEENQREIIINKAGFGAITDWAESGVSP